MLLSITGWKLINSRLRNSPGEIIATACYHVTLSLRRQVSVAPSFAAISASAYLSSQSGWPDWRRIAPRPWQHRWLCRTQ